MGSSATKPVAAAVAITRDLSVRYDGAGGAALAGAQLEVRPGEVVLLLGPSGCGKSTLAMTLNGLIPHSLPASMSGEVEVLGAPTVDRTVAELSVEVGMVFQDPDAQVVTATVFDEVAFGCENLLLPVPEVRERALAALHRVGLGDRASDDPDELSGGGRQRLAVACALAMRPRLLVLDEPTANLDPAATRELYLLLGELVAEHAHSVLLIEHDVDEAIGIVDRVIVLDGSGATRCAGPPAEVFGGRGADIAGLEVWQPTAALVAQLMCAAGSRFVPVPLTPADFAQHAHAAPALVPPVPEPPLPDRPPAVVVRDLTVRFLDRVALADVDLTVPSGDFLAVVGANGAGKTTLGRAIAGVHRPPRAAVHAGGMDVSTADSVQLSERVGFVFQNPEHQFVTGSVFDELAFGLRVRRRPAAEIDDRVAQALSDFSLGGLDERNPFLLSHGQKRRLSVATAVITEPDVLVLDEPTFGQDRVGAAALLSELVALNRSGTTLIVITHDLQTVAEHARNVLVLIDGRVAAHRPTAGVVGDAPLLAAAGLTVPPIARIAAVMAEHDPSWRGVRRLADIRFGTRPAGR